ncbi:MAG: prolipoprotein diacylglyceryl transferase [Calditrichaeota bacterium]|nr:prolipoprotein diacylglyceryl transferase [Calditrichota bacterium]MCB9365619.1 prolipoprotein diacylglyceryl transferase [Calditrichota bacterium]
MHPELFKIGPFALHSYGLMMALAFGFGLWIASKRAPGRDVSASAVMDVSVASLLFGLAGGRIAYVFTHWHEFEGRYLDIISPVQSDGTIGIAGLVLLGGVVAGFGGAYWMARKRDVRFLTLTDIMIPSLALGIAFGRIGCFLNGCCFGLECTVPWGVVFPESSLAGSVFPHTHVHPTQLYEVLAMVVLFFFLLWRDRKPLGEGVLTGWFLILYGIWRYYVEGIRWYESGMVFGQIGDHRITFSRIISAAMVAVGLFLIRRKAREVRQADAD